MYPSGAPRLKFRFPRRTSLSGVAGGVPLLDSPADHCGHFRPEIPPASPISRPLPRACHRGTFGVQFRKRRIPKSGNSWPTWRRSGYQGSNGSVAGRAGRLLARVEVSRDVH